MRLYVQAVNEWITISCKENELVENLINMTIKKYNKLKNPRKEIEKKDIVSIRRVKNGALLDPEDVICSVLAAEEYVKLDLEAQDQGGDFKNDIPNLYSEIEYFPKEFNISKEVLLIDGNSMTPEHLVALGKGFYSIKIALKNPRDFPDDLIDLSEDAIKKVKKGRELVDKIVSENKVVYGITTGFGKFSDVVIDQSKMIKLQENLIRSHSSGVGNPMSIEQARMMLALRINTLTKGYSGITLENLNKLVDAFNVGVVPWIPVKGSVGASGDLAPLAHLALGLMGEGKVWSPKTGWTDSKHALSSNGLSPLKLQAKEGLSLINGTQFITSLGTEALTRAANIANQADIIAALSLEVLKGTTKAFESMVHEIRPHCGQIKVASRLRSLLHSNRYPSEISISHRTCSMVQDAYSLRCCPQVHGIVQDTIDFVRKILITEMNSATDNPLVFSDSGDIISAGNFHGEYPAKVLDYLAIAVHEIANMSERRIERLINPAYSALPAFLVKEGGLNSGFMVAHVTAAALVSENKVLTHPSSVDSLSTSGGQEDHVSMGAYASRKAVEVVSNVENVLAIELLAAVQGLEFLRPLKSTEPLEAVVRLIRKFIRPLDRDRFMAQDIDKVTDILRKGEVWKAVEPYIDITEPIKGSENLVPHSVTDSHRCERKRKIFKINISDKSTSSDSSGVCQSMSELRSEKSSNIEKKRKGLTKPPT